MMATPEVLKSLPLFSDLSREECEFLLHSSRLHRIERGSLLFLHGDPVTHFYALCRGTMQVFRETPDGHEITDEILIPGDTLGADEILRTHHTHLHSARAVDDAMLLEIPVTWMKANLKDFDHIAARLLTGLSDRLHQAQIEAEHRATMSAAQMVACFLERLCVLYDFDPRGFELPISKTLIASRLRMELETFSRTLKKLKEHGIEVEGTQVKFTHIDKARHFVCDDCSIHEDCPTHRVLKAVQQQKAKAECG